ncbi:retrotransposon hot spot (RHS) protein, partial [Trypanosoma conorhini]
EMSGRSEEELSRFLRRTPANDVPRGLRHARAEPERSDSTAPPAQRRRVEEAPARQRWTLTSTVKDVLLEGEGPIPDIKLNDFLRDKLSGRGVVEANENLSIENFIALPEAFITNENDRRLILSLPFFKAIEDARNLRADARNLMEHRVGTLQRWKEFEHKEIVSNVSWAKLDAALAAVEEANESATRIQAVGRLPIPKEFYDSVFNAKWSHVLGFPEGEGDAMVMRMEVREGQRPALSWQYAVEGVTLLPVEDADQFRAPRLRLTILSSEKGWPYSLQQGKTIADCYVTREVERVWRIVKGDLDGAFGPRGLQYFEVRRRLLIGTPGIGKSMAAGSYLLHQLLHYDDTKLQVVVYCFGAGLAYVFDKTNKTVAEYVDGKEIIILIKVLAGRGIRGYIIYDVDKKGQGPDGFPSPATWGFILLSSPNEDNFKSWGKQKDANLIVMNCPDENDVKAMCAWETRANSAQVQKKHWETIKKRMYYVGPIQRCIFDEDTYGTRLVVTTQVLGGANASNAHNYISIVDMTMWPANDASHKLVKAVRVTVKGAAETFVNLPVCLHLGHRLLIKLTEVGKQRDVLYQLWRLRDLFLPELLEKYGVHAFTDRGFVDNIKRKIKELRPSRVRPGRPCVLQSNPETHPGKSVPLTLLEFKPPKLVLECGVLYVPDSQIFPLIDGFFFVKSPRKTMVGLQATVRGEHHTQPGTVKLFMELMAKYFNGWETFAADLSWEIIYVQHRESEAITTWQRCENSTNVREEKDAAQRREAEEEQEDEKTKAKKKKEKEEKEIAVCWKENAYQYQVAISAEDVRPENNAQRRQGNYYFNEFGSRFSCLSTF